jgi:hypothetical protein
LRATLILDLSQLRILRLQAFGDVGFVVGDAGFVERRGPTLT